MYYADLTPYEYFFLRQSDSEIFNTHVLNVGWLSCKNKYPKGTVPQKTLNKIKKLCATSYFNLMRGYHKCDLRFCLGFCISAKDGSTPRQLGSAEIWVRGKDNVVYVAPDLIFHYIKYHRYLPPGEFLNAIDEMDDAFIKEGEWDCETPLDKFVLDKLLLL